MRTTPRAVMAMAILALALIAPGCSLAPRIYFELFNVVDEPRTIVFEADGVQATEITVPACSRLVDAVARPDRWTVRIGESDPVELSAEPAIAEIGGDVTVQLRLELNGAAVGQPRPGAPASLAVSELDNCEA
ncbi:MAG: hypothetical protein ACRDGD_05805 [Candidatus Limnocylindria bacterium]